MPELSAVYGCTSFCVVDHIPHLRLDIGYVVLLDEYLIQPMFPDCD
jgi:hypothetical protein